MAASLAYKYVGLPFVAGGRTPQGVDCFGLIRLVLDQEVGIQLPLNDMIKPHEVLKIADALAKALPVAPWSEVPPRTPYQDFDVVLMRPPGEPLEGHMGIILDGQLLHSEEHSDTVSVPLDHSTVVRRITRVLRHKDL